MEITDIWWEPKCKLRMEWKERTVEYGELEKYLKSKWNQHFAKALDEEKKKGSLLE